ncbi:MAG TPA: ABC transporter substrate-binding protein [Myxococcales bacterium]|nr:ABC transporter substrate-binding protein [Myxococcales bacterium]
MKRLLLFAAVLACKAKAPAAPQAAARAPDKIVVAATLPVGTREGQTARFIHEGYELAFEVANREGGVTIGGRKVPLELVLEDDRDDPARGVSILKASNASFFLGSSSAKVIDAESDFAETQQSPYVIALGASRNVFDHGARWAFGLQAPLELLAYTQMRWIDEQQKAHRLPTPFNVALLIEDSARGREFRKGVIDFTEKTPSRRLSYKVVFDEKFAPDAQDFTAQLARLKAANADGLLADTSEAEFKALHRQYLLRGLCHKVLSYGAHGIEADAAEAFGYNGLAYILSAVWWSARQAKGGPSAKFAEVFKDTYHRDPDWYSALSYEASRALIEAIRRAGGVDRAAVRQQLLESKMASILPGGRLIFNSDQQAAYPFVVQQIQPDGSVPMIFPNDVAESPGVAANPKCK